MSIDQHPRQYPHQPGNNYPGNEQAPGHRYTIPYQPDPRQVDRAPQQDKSGDEPHTLRKWLSSLALAGVLGGGGVGVMAIASHNHHTEPKQEPSTTAPAVPGASGETVSTTTSAPETAVFNTPKVVDQDGNALDPQIYGQELHDKLAHVDSSDLDAYTKAGVLPTIEELVNAGQGSEAALKKTELFQGGSVQNNKMALTADLPLVFGNAQSNRRLNPGDPTSSSQSLYGGIIYLNGVLSEAAQDSGLPSVAKIEMDKDAKCTINALPTSGDEPAQTSVSCPVEVSMYSGNTPIDNVKQPYMVNYTYEQGAVNPIKDGAFFPVPVEK